MGIFIIAKK